MLIEDDEVITDENALRIVRIIKKSSDEVGINILKTMLDTAQEKIVELIRELTKKNLPQPSDYTNNKITLEEDLP